MLKLKKVFFIVILSTVSMYQAVSATTTNFTFKYYEIELGKIYRQLIFHHDQALSSNQLHYLKKYHHKSSLFQNKQAILNTVISLNRFKGSLKDSKYCQQLVSSTNTIQQKILPWCYRQIIKRYKHEVKRRHITIEEQKIFFSTLNQKQKYLFMFFRSLPKSTNKIATKQLLGFLLNQQQPLPFGLKKYLYYDSQLKDFIKQQEKPISTNKNYISYLLQQLYRNFKQANREHDFVKLQAIAQQTLSLYAEHPNSFPSYLNYIFVIIGRSFLNNQYPKVAQEYFKNLFLIKRAHKVKDSNKFLFYYLWSYIRNNQFQEALAKIYKFQLLDNLETYPIQIKFWLAYTFQKTGEEKMAHYIYGEIIKSNPLSYYAIMANGRLKYNKNSFIKRLFKLNQTPLSKYPANLNPTELKQIREIAFWFTVNCPQIANNQLAIVLNNIDQQNRRPSSKYLNKQAIMQNIINFLQVKKQYLSLFQAVFKNIDSLSKTTLKRMVQYLFPFEYFEQIKKLTKKINPIVILSLIRQESGFNPKAESQPGARGLMQLMPQTAFGLNITNTQQLYIPKHNLKAGIKYFEQLLETFNHNLILALAAYNAGPTKVKQWTTDFLQNPDPLITIEEIPYKETRTYVKLIYRNIFFYNLLKNIKQRPILTKR